MHAGQGSEGPAAGGDPKQKTDCTFANRFFQTTVSTANKPEFFSAGVAGLLCWGGGRGWIPLSVSRRFYPSEYCWPRGGGLGQVSRLQVSQEVRERSGGGLQGRWLLVGED